MDKIRFPQPLENLLKDTELFAPIRDYANRVGEILDDKQMPFFPSYTDHSCEHINQVLQAEVELIPAKVWELSKTDHPQQSLLRPEDATVLIGGTLLHDIAMHLHPDGFLELVSENSRFQPLPWFKDEQQGHRADRPWRELWLDYQREARRFSDGKLGEIVGMDDVRQGWKFETLPPSPGLWQQNHRLVIGEFIRRHHARLAHEIAHYGFPGLEIGHDIQQFPALAKPGHPLENLADLIGLTARSHGLNLRTCQAYLDSRYGKRGPRHRGCAVLYPMALLRVADYLQIDRSRTPAILLKLRNPQSPVSVQEWQKHLALLNIDDAHDPWGKSVEVSGQISHGVYLQLRELLDGLQKEMDHATAVLDEAYGRHEGLNHLSLTTRRVHSNLTEPAFRASLPYVPERTGYSTDPNLLTLLVEPLYGKEPGVGVRELMQNSVDAVRELHAWCENHGQRVEDLDLPDQEADVQIDFIQREDGSWFLRVTDKGIGMTADTIQNYFLRAGASFRQSPEWTKEFVNDDGKPKVLRAGRFGIGAFAIFLLGPRFRLWTRHVTADKSQGYYLEADGDSIGIEIRKEKRLNLGTTVMVDISHEIPISNEYGYENDWFCWDWPIVSRRIVQAIGTTILMQRHKAPIEKIWLSPEWSIICPTNFYAVYWTFKDHPYISCNGIEIGSRNINYGDGPADFDWPASVKLSKPKIAVRDNNGLLSLEIRRYRLQDRHLPFIAELSRDVTLSFIAHSLILCPSSRGEAHFQRNTFKPHPLAPEEADNPFSSALRWCSSASALIPADDWLYSLLGTQECSILGAIESTGLYPRKDKHDDVFSSFQISEQSAMLSWRGKISDNDSDIIQFDKNFAKLIKSGFGFFDRNTVELKALVSFVRMDVFGEFGATEGIEIKGKKYRWNHLPVKSKPKTIFPSNHLSMHHFLYCCDKTSATNIPTKDFINRVESVNLSESKKGYRGSSFGDKIFFVFEIKTTPTNPQPETLLAKLWNECLGPNPIPFDPEARRALIERGRLHPELKRHIEAWEEMKRTGSKWVYGEDKAE